MSAFLGHIHYWLYRKIQLLVERENLILEKTSKVVDDLAEELHSISVDTYGEPINPSIPLENIIDHGNIRSNRYPRCLCSTRPSMWRCGSRQP